jgi:radical SAM protein with 4Fe4S-binding SPASM domain
VIYPPFIQLYPTLRCNQSCYFCFNRNIAGSVASADMPGKNAYALAGILAEAKVQELDMLGGEPMLVPWMREYAEYVTGLGIRINISTNGSLPYTVDKFSHIRELLNIGFSVLGLQETHDSLTMGDNFQKAIEVIRALIKKGGTPIVKSVLTSRNRHEIHELACYLATLGVGKYYLLHEDFIGRENLNNCISFPEFYGFYAELRKELKGRMEVGFVAASGFHRHCRDSHGICNAGRTKIALLPDGSAFPCNLFFGFPGFRLGNIFTDGLENIWDSPVLEIFRKAIKKRCPEDNCRYYSACSGGCPAHSFYFFGTINKPDPRCTAGRKENEEILHN